MITPNAFYGRKPIVSHFRVFRGIVYFHVSKDRKKKLEPTTELGVFVGYTETTNNYYVYLPSLKMIVIRRDVNFDNEKAM